MSNRAAYNKLRNDMIRERRAALELFRQQNPEKYSELMSKAVAEVSQPCTTPNPHQSNTQIPTSLQTTQDNSNRLDELIAKIADGRKDYFIDIEIAHDGWVEEHTFFEMLRTPEDAATKITERHGFVDFKVTRVEKCSCPLCV